MKMLKMVSENGQSFNEFVLWHKERKENECELDNKSFDPYLTELSVHNMENNVSI